MDSDDVIKPAAEFPSKIGAEFISWFTRSDDAIEGKSKQKAYALFDGSFIDAIEVGTVKDLRQIHEYLFGGLYDLAGQLNIAKGGFLFAPVMFLRKNLKIIEKCRKTLLKTL